MVGEALPPLTARYCCKYMLLCAYLIVNCLSWAQLIDS